MILAPSIHKGVFFLVVIVMSSVLLMTVSESQGAELFTGSWKFIYVESGSSYIMDLKQKGNFITGTQQLSVGKAVVYGIFSGNSLYLIFSYDNPEVLTNWVKRKVADQIVGITGLAVFTVSPQSESFEGVSLGFFVKWDNNQSVFLKAIAGSEKALNSTKPSAVVLQRNTE